MNHNSNLVELRSYSTVFSSSYFSDLLQEDDYKLLNSKIRNLRNHHASYSFMNYYEFLTFIYSTLQNKYRSEYIYKNTFINEVLIKRHSTINSIILNEFRVGKSVADLVLINGSSKAFEIKTELDSNKRLGNQLADYMKIFNECYIITYEALVEKYTREDERVGIIELYKQGSRFKMREVRKARANLNIDPETLIRAVRTVEYKNIVKSYYGYLPEMNSFNMFQICLDLIKDIPTEVLNQLFIAELKKRKSNTGILHTFPKELRQLFLSMKLDEKTYLLIDNKLKKSINL